MVSLTRLCHFYPRLIGKHRELGTILNLSTSNLPTTPHAMCCKLHKSVRALIDTGSNVQFLHYLLANQQARYFLFFSESGLVHLQTSLALFVLLYQKCWEKLDYLQNELSCSGFTPVDLYTIKWACDSHSSVGCLGLF